MIRLCFWTSPVAKRILVAMTIIGVVALAALVARSLTRSPTNSETIPTPSVSNTKSVPAGPPWIYGRADARFTLVEYADLECLYCREYFPVLRSWIDTNPEVNWQWHHLPLSIHDPAATRSARLAECAGEAHGNAGFWDTIAWIYQHTRGGGAGLREDTTPPSLSAPIQACLDSDRPDLLIRAQANAASGDQITATPTLRLIDHKTSKTLTLQGLIGGDALLSAMDMLASSPNEPPQISPK